MRTLLSNTGIVGMLVGLALALAGCGSGGGVPGVGNNVAGQVQKGPFAIGSQISVNELDSNLNPNGKVYSVETTDDLGNFTLHTTVTLSQVEIVGTGFYMDETSGQLSTSQISLRAFVDLSVNSTPTINVLTSLQAQRLWSLIAQGSTYAAAYAQSQTEVLAAFGIDSTKVSGLSNLFSMRINGSSDADSVLLATSAVLSRMAATAATANGTTQSAELSNFVNTMASQLAITGSVSSAIAVARAFAETQVDLSAVRSNLETYYQNRGLTIVAPKFEEWVDHSGSGVLPQRLASVTSLVFAKKSAATPGLQVTSDAVTVAGLGTGVAAPVTVNTGTILLKNNSVVSGSSTIVVNGDTLAMRVTSLDYSLVTTATITVGSSSATWQVETAPPAPIMAFAVSGTTQATITWPLVSTATSYNIYWATSPGVTTASNKITGATSPHVQTGLTAGNSYFYRVASVNASLETLSEEVFTFVYAGGSPAGTFAAAGNMTRDRYAGTSTLLADGRVLIVGGVSSGNAFLALAEVYDPATNIFTNTGSPLNVRAGHTATRLRNGKVLVTGGQLPAGALASAAVYDPATGVFTATGNMTIGRQGHVAALLPNGKVLVVGGSSVGANNTGPFASAEIYDPDTGLFTLTGSMARPKENSLTATLLTNGKVLVTGIEGANLANRQGKAEIYNPATGTFTATGSMLVAQPVATATLLPNGKVLFAGGEKGDNSTVFSNVEVYDPATGLFTANGNMTSVRSRHTATLLPNGKVLFAGGIIDSPYAANTASAEIYDPDTGTSTATGSMTVARMSHLAVLLRNGKVLQLGGYAQGGITATTELFQ